MDEHADDAGRAFSARHPLSFQGKMKTLFFSKIDKSLTIPENQIVFPSDKNIHLTLIRLFPNIYTDLTGTVPGWRANISLEEWRRYLWFPEASGKILFGSDVHYADFSDNLRAHEAIFDACGWGDTEKAKVYQANTAGLFAGNKSVPAPGKNVPINPAIPTTGKAEHR